MEPTKALAEAHLAAMTRTRSLVSFAIKDAAVTEWHCSKVSREVQCDGFSHYYRRVLVTCHEAEDDPQTLCSGLTPGGSGEPREESVIDPGSNAFDAAPSVS